MMKGVMIHQPNLQQSPALDNQENMSNVTSAASGEASVSSSNGGVYPHQQHYFGGNTINNQPQPQPQQIKKKRNQPGNPGFIFLNYYIFCCFFLWFLENGLIF